MIAVLIGLSLLLISAASAEEINWQVLSSGGTDGTSTNYDLKGTVAQTATGEGNSPNYELSHGFWHVFGTGADGCCGIYTGGITGNSNCSTDGKLTLSDITQLIDNVYISKADPESCMPACEQ